MHSYAYINLSADRQKYVVYTSFFFCTFNVRVFPSVRVGPLEVERANGISNLPCRVMSANGKSDDISTYLDCKFFFAEKGIRTQQTSLASTIISHCTS